MNFNNIPADTVPSDRKNQAVTYAIGENNYRFSVFGESVEPANDVKNTWVDFWRKITYIEIGVFVGNGSHQVVSKVEKPVLATGSGYKSMDMQGSRFIQLDMRSKASGTVPRAVAMAFWISLNPLPGRMYSCSSKIPRIHLPINLKASC